MKIKHIAAAAALVAATGSSFAAIAPGGQNDNSELFFVVTDTTAQISYTLDLGQKLGAFFVNGQSNNGMDLTMAISADANFQSFLAQTNPANLQWVVMGVDTFGPVSGSNHRLFGTVQNGVSSATVASTLNLNLRNGIASANNFLNAVNPTGTHTPANDFTVNGSSVNAIADTGVSYFGEAGGTGPRLQANALPFSMANAVNTSSAFVMLGSTATNGVVAVDAFNNAANSGAWTFAREQVAGSPVSYSLNYHIQAVPEPGSLALLMAGLGAIGFVGRRRKSV